MNDIQKHKRIPKGDTCTKWYQVCSLLPDQSIPFPNVTIAKHKNDKNEERNITNYQRKKHACKPRSRNAGLFYRKILVPVQSPNEVDNNHEPIERGWRQSLTTHFQRAEGKDKNKYRVKRVIKEVKRRVVVSSIRSMTLRAISYPFHSASCSVAAAVASPELVQPQLD